MKSSCQVHLNKLKEMLPNVRSAFAAKAGDPLLAAILQSISIGLSPVKGVGRFKRYSDTYVEAMLHGAYRQFDKKQRPVNLYLSGAMLGAGTASPNMTGTRISFRHYLADIHNAQGAGKSKVIRHFLPTNSGEEFSRTIMSPIYSMLQKLVSEEVARQNQ